MQNYRDENDKPTEMQLEYFLSLFIDGLKMLKPNDKSETDRNYAVCLTEAEKLYAYFVTYLMKK
jgi:hypothetical protein